MPRLTEAVLSELLPTFWSSDFANKLANPSAMRDMLAICAANPKECFELTFYASFAKRMLEVMRREGKQTLGFDRMQQSFTEAVQKVTTIIEKFGTLGFAQSNTYVSSSPGAMQAILVLIDDLTIVKEWQLTVEQKQT
jgi:hypothetical protein